MLAWTTALPAWADEPDDPPAWVVQGDRDPVVSASVTVVDPATLPDAADVADAVDTAPGAVVQRLGGLGDWAGVSLRGSTLRQVLVTLDGVPLNPDGQGAIDLSELPLRAFSRVEVYRGLAPPELSSTAMGGVVNLVTPDGAMPSTVSVTGGAWATGRVHASTAPALSVLGRPGRLFVAFDGLSTQGGFRYLDDRGTVYTSDDDVIARRGNDDTGQLAVHARLAVGDDRLRYTVLGAALARDEGVPGPIGAPAAAARLGTARGVAVAQVEAGGDRLRGTGRLWTVHREERLDDRLGEVGVGSELTRDLTSTVGVHLSGRYAVVPGAALVAVAEARSDAWRGGDGMAEPDRRSRLAGNATVAASIRAARERVGLFPAVQATWVQRAATAVTPRLGALVRPVGPLVIRANAGTYLRAPDFLELYGDRGAIVGNPDLRPERGWQADVGGRVDVPGPDWLAVSADVAHFWGAARDGIVWVQNSQRTSYPINLDRSWVQGVEAALSADVDGRVRTRTGLTRTVSVNLSPDPAYANNRLPRIPGWELEHRTEVAVGPVRLGHGVSFTSGAYWDATNWYPSAARLLHDASATVDAGPWHVGVDVRNLADTLSRTERRNPLDPTDHATVERPITDFVGYPLPGRTVLATVRWTAP